MQNEKDRKAYDEIVAPGGVTIEEFEAFERVRKTGQTNMDDQKVVEILSGGLITKNKWETIVRNHEGLRLFYPSVREYLVTYRKGDFGEIEALVVAKSPEEAVRKFLNGECEYQVNPEVLSPEFVEAECLED
jgi:hypothetical protein